MKAATPSYFNGRLINLRPIDIESMSKAYVTWQRDTEYFRLADDEPAKLFTPDDDRKWLERNWDSMIMFAIHRAGDGEMIGSIELAEIQWVAGEAWVGIGIGQRENWGKGYGTEAMQMLLRYAFEELNLHRVSLSVFDYNARGIRSYEKAGFQEEGRIRQACWREGRGWDLVYMGILRSEWEGMSKVPGGKA